MPTNVQAISKRFGTKWVLRDVSFDILDGEILGICGASGSGKSTLLRVIAGLHESDAGTVFHDGIDLLSVKSKERGVFLKDPETTRGLTLGFALPRIPRMSAGEKKAEKLVDAISSKEVIVLLDEPLLHMHPELQEQWSERLRERAAAGSVLIASSDFENLARMCDRIAMLDGGEIPQVGAPEEIYETPATISIARLTGDQNLIEARRLTSNDADLPEFLTIHGEHRIFAQPTEKQKLGSINKNVMLAIRPEQIVISTGASFPEDNLLRAVVKRIRFCGPTHLIEFDASGLSLEARVFKVVGLHIDDECMLGLPPNRIAVLAS